MNNGGGNAEVNVSANIAIAFSGGASSRALLRSAVQYFRPESSIDSNDRKNSKRSNGGGSGRFNEVGKVYVIYVDDCAVMPDGSGVDRTEAARRMVEEEKCSDLIFVPVKIEDIYRMPSGSTEGVPWKLIDGETQLLSPSTSPVSDPTTSIKALFSSLHPASTPRTGASSARTRIEDLHRIFLHSLLRRTASQLSCSALLLGDSATRISIRLIEDLAKGAGHKLPVQGSDAVWIDDLLIVRPLKGHLLQEVLFYTAALGLEELQPEQNIVPPLLSTREILESGSGKKEAPFMDKSSIARLTETFILNLEKGVASTVTTIGKTGGKLVLNAPASPADGEESASNSTTAFQQVGPSVPLNSRNGVTDKMANLTVSRQSEPRIGSRGIKLAQTSASCFHWETRQGCALCGMPSQNPQARHWKRNITISSLSETEPTQHAQARTGGAEEGEKGWIELGDHLCYACLLVLSPPGEAQGGESFLPVYVLDHIQRSTGKVDELLSDNNGVHADAEEGSDEQPAQHAHTAHVASHNSVSKPLDRSDVKAQIDEFLIEDA